MSGRKPMFGPFYKILSLYLFNGPFSSLYLINGRSEYSRATYQNASQPVYLFCTEV